MQTPKEKNKQQQKLVPQLTSDHLIIQYLWIILISLFREVDHCG